MKIKIERGKPMEFSKKILIAEGIINIIVISFTLFMVYKTENLEPLIYLVPSVAAAVAIGTAFYYDKAKVENRIKLMKQNKVEPTEESFRGE